MKWVQSLAMVMIGASGVLAGAEVAVRSDAPARVYFDGQDIGEAPLRIRNVDPGFHEIRLVSRDTGASQRYEFYSPRTTTVQKEIDARLAGGVEHGAHGGPAAADYEVAGDSYSAPPPRYEEDEDRSYDEGRRYERERRKVRTRNTLLGAGLLNELLNKGSSKKTVRGVALGGVLLNELINRDRQE